MFDRKAFKAAALHSLRGKWKTSLLVSVLGLAIQGIATLPFTRIYFGEASYHHSFHLDLTSLLFLLPLAITGVSTIGQTFFFTRLATDKDSTSFSTFSCSRAAVIAETKPPWLQPMRITLPPCT